MQVCIQQKLHWVKSDFLSSKRVDHCVFVNVVKLKIIDAQSDKNWLGISGADFGYFALVIVVDFQWSNNWDENVLLDKVNVEIFDFLVSSDHHCVLSEVVFAWKMKNLHLAGILNV